MAHISIIYLLALFSLVSMDVTSGRWMIKEMANINYYPRRDLDFIEIHAKDFKFDPFNYNKLGWSVDIYNMTVVDIANKNLDPGVLHMDANSITWTMKEAFYVEVEFDYVHNLGVLPMAGKGTIYMHCDNAEYKLKVENTNIQPSISCKSIAYKDVKIRHGVNWESIKNHINITYNTDTQLYSKLVNTFKTVMINYYYEEYRDKTGSITFTDLHTKINVFFAWTGTRTNIKDTTLEFEYQIKFTSTFSDKIVSTPFLPTQPIGSAPEEYSRMYFIDKQLILDVANVILPKYINQPIYSNDVPHDSYWQLQYWNLQKVLPDLLLIHPNNDSNRFRVMIDYFPSLSKPQLDVVTHFSDMPYYRVSGLVFNITLQGENAEKYLLKTRAHLYADLTPVATEVASDSSVVLQFTATNGGIYVLDCEEDFEEGGFVYYRGLDEFLSEGLNDYMIKQQGHYAFGSGLSFQDFAHKGKIAYTEPRSDGVYIYLD